MKQKDWSEKQSNAIFALLFILVSIGLAFIAVFTDSSINSSLDLYDLILFGSLVGIVTITFIVIIIYNRKKKKEAEVEVQVDTSVNSEVRLQRLFDDVDRSIDSSRRLWRSSEPVFISNNDKERKFNASEYLDTPEGQKCSICKLEIRKKQKIFQCQKCLSLFHQKHLEEWLEKNPTCPICGAILLI